MLEYEMETISSVSDIKHNGTDECSRYFHIFQIHDKLNIEWRSSNTHEERQTLFRIRQQQETMQLKKYIWNNEEKVAVSARFPFPTCTRTEQPHVIRYCSKCPAFFPSACVFGPRDWTFSWIHTNSKRLCVLPFAWRLTLNWLGDGNGLPGALALHVLW